MKFFGDKATHNISTHSPNLMSGDMKRNKMCLSLWEAYFLVENQQRPKHSSAEGLVYLRNYKYFSTMGASVRITGDDRKLWGRILTVTGGCASSKDGTYTEVQ